MPPQFGKSDLLVNGLARLLRRQPWRRNAYASFADRVARKKSRQCRDLAEAAGCRIRDDSHAVTDWQTVEGGGLFATSTGGALTSLPVDGILVIDDPHKDRADAESALSRENLWDWWTSTASKRVHPVGSIIVCHTRWMPDDFIGRLSKDGGWEIVNLPAIDEQGRPLWRQRPLAFLEQQRRISEYDWHSLYMGSPRPRGTAVFRGVKYYDALPTSFRIGKGADLAYTARTRADYSCALVLLKGGKDDEGRELFYVAEVRREQCEVPDFVRTLGGLDVSYPGSWHWFCSTTEKGVAQVVSSGDVRIDAVLATADKFVRAQPVATAWNEGRIRVPRNAPWLKAFVDELGGFTGVSDRHDDQVDALASAHASIGQAVEPPRIIPGSGSRWGDSSRGF